MPYDALIAIIVASIFTLIYLFDKKFTKDKDSGYTFFADMFLLFAIVFIWIALVTSPAITSINCDLANVTSSGLCLHQTIAYGSLVTINLTNGLFDLYTFVCLSLGILVFLQMLSHISNMGESVSDKASE